MTDPACHLPYQHSHSPYLPFNLLLWFVLNRRDLLIILGCMGIWAGGIHGRQCGLGLVTIGGAFRHQTANNNNSVDL